jgi:hypothetical protein
VSPSPGATHIIFNPPSSEASVYHTPLKFLPKSDPRRRLYLQSILRNAAPSSTLSTTPGASETDPASGSKLPPALKEATAKTYHLTPEDVKQIQRLRESDPVKNSINKLAAKFNCSPAFVIMVAKTPRAHKEKVEARLERVKARWGARKTRARVDRAKRKDLLYRGEL